MPSTRLFKCIQGPTGTEISRLTGAMKYMKGVLINF